MRLSSRDENAPFNSVYLPVTYDREQADRVRVHRGQLTEYAASIGEPGFLSGAMSGSWALLDKRTWVKAFTIDEEFLASAYCDDSGAFAFQLFGEHALTLQVSVRQGSPQFDIPRWIRDEQSGAKEVFNLAPGESFEGISHPVGGIQITVEGPEEPVNNSSFCWFRLLDSNQTNIFFELFGYNSDMILEGPNPIVIPNIAAGSYTLHFSPKLRTQTWLSQYYDNVEDISIATPVVLAEAGDLVPVTVTLVEGGKILGNVFLEEGSPALETSLFLTTNFDSTRVKKTTSTDPQTGAFSFVGLRDGNYKVAAENAYGGRTWYPGTSSWQSADEITIEELGVVEGIDWTLQE